MQVAGVRQALLQMDLNSQDQVAASCRKHTRWHGKYDRRNGTPWSSWIFLGSIKTWRLLAPRLCHPPFRIASYSARSEAA